MAFKDTLVGGILENVKDGKPLTTFDFALETSTIVRLSLAFVACTITYFVIKKYMFNY